MAGLMMQTCTACKQVKSLDGFHRQPSGKNGRHCYCRECFNARYRGIRRRSVAPDVRRAQNFKSRYGLSPSAVQRLLDAQGGTCAICDKEPQKPCVDHDHETGKVRAILCHACNIALPHIENANFRNRALAYLEAHK